MCQPRPREPVKLYPLEKTPIRAPAIRCLYEKDHSACPGEENEEKGRASCYPEAAPRWEKGHRMALSSGSSVSEDVWTLIKMCRASGRALFLSSIPFSLPSFSRLPFAFLPRLLSFVLQFLLARCMRAIGLRLLKRPGSVTWTAAARSSMRRAYATRGCVVISCHRPTTDWPAGFEARQRIRSLRLPVWYPIVAPRPAKTETVPAMCAAHRDEKRDGLDDRAIFLSRNKIWKLETK